MSRSRPNLTKHCRSTAWIASVARKKIVERMEAAGLIEKIEPHTHMVPHGDRSTVVIEPYLTDQWYVDAEDAGAARARSGARRQDRVRAEELGEDLLRLDGKHPAVVRLAPALVGTSDSGVVRAGRQVFRRRDRSRSRRRGEEGTTARTRRSTRDRGRARHLVLVGAVAVLDARLAGQDAGGEALLPDRRAGHRLRHHLLLGRPHDDDGTALHEEGAVPHRLHPPLVRDEKGAKMSKSKGNVIDPLGLIDDYGADALRFALARDGGAKPRHQAVAAACREQSQFCDQALERRALCRVQRRRARRGLRSEIREGNAQSLDRARDRESAPRGHRSDRELPVQ